jgi:hypothetical protein
MDTVPTARTCHQGPSRTRVTAWLCVSALVAAAAAGCADSADESRSSGQLRPTVSVQDIMLSVVDPAADAIWESVATIVTHDGTEERRPSTDEEWVALRHEAVRLVEATNLMLMEGRTVARSGFQSENPGIELEPEEIQALIDADPTTWNRMSADYYRVARTMLSAIEDRDADRLFDEGGSLNTTCERCHQEYWYPGDTSLELIAAAEAARRSMPAPTDVPAAGATDGRTGTIQGHVQLAGELPGNVVIRMGVDPLCAQRAEGKQLTQQTVLTAPDGSLANVFIRLDGTFPETPVPDEPVVIDQMDCIFAPRVVGVRAGQLVQIQNSDPLLHNLNSRTSTPANRFNVGQPVQGMVYEVRLEEEEAEDGMLGIRCDLHRWMTEYIGIVSHPYFDVTDLTGTFTLADVPAGTHMIRVWHEEYGVLTQAVTVEANGVAVADFIYPG